MKIKLIHPQKFSRKGVIVWRLPIGKKATVHHLKISAPISKRRSLRCDRTYYIISGDAEFRFGNKKMLVKKNEAIRIPKNTTYSYKPLDKIELVEINLPPYDEKYEKVDL